jgi:hypothetical protein
MKPMVPTAAENAMISNRSILYPELVEKGADFASSGIPALRLSHPSNLRFVVSYLHKLVLTEVQ